MLDVVQTLYQKSLPKATGNPRLEALSHMTEHRHGDTRTSWTCQNPIVGLCLTKAKVRQSPRARLRSAPAQPDSRKPGLLGVPAVMEPIGSAAHMCSDTAGIPW